MLKSKRGTVLITLIITMTIMAVLGAAMTIFLVTSSLTELYLNQANQAQYLAESGVRFGHSSPLVTISPTTPFTLANVPGQIKIGKNVNNYIVSTGIINSGTQNQMRTIKWGPSTKRPLHNSVAFNASAATNPTLLASLDTSGTVSGQVSNTSLQVANGGCTGGETFVTFQNLTPFANPETSGCNIGCNIGSLVVPLLNSTTDNNNPVKKMRDTWTAYGQVSYDVQVKISWVINSSATPNTADAAQGINIRWHESATAGKYEGYGISFMEYRSRTSCSSANLDYIPCNLKPCVGNPCGNDNTLAAKLLLILWQQKVVSGIETKTWLAYANLGIPATGHYFDTPGDPKVLGGQSSVDSLYVNDNASLVIRIEDKTTFTGLRYNDIKIYYGENSDPAAGRTAGPPATRGFDAAATNINRGAYAPVCSGSTWTPSWPSSSYEPYSDNTTLTYWSYSGWWSETTYAVNNVVIPDYRDAADGLHHSYRCTTAGTSGKFEPTWPASGTVTDGTVTWQENGTARPTSYDYFTMGSANPVIDTHTVSLTVNSAVVNDVSTNLNPTATVMLQSDRATIRTYDFLMDSFPTTRPEIALHAMGYLNSTRGYVGFADFSTYILGIVE